MRKYGIPEKPRGKSGDNFMETKDILITGGLGFVGSNIAMNLVKHSQNVIIATSSKRNIWRLTQKSDSIKLVELDVTNENRVMDTFNLLKPDIIINNSVFGAYHENDQNKIFQVNLSGLINTVKSYLRTQADLLINTSTISEYGVKNSPFEETDQLNPLGDYAISKAAATMYCESTRKLTKRNILTTRIANPYGPLENSQDLIPYLIIKRMKDEDVKLNNPNNVRDFIYIDDVAEAYWKIISSYNEVDSSIFNIATGVETRIDELAKLVGEIVPGKERIKVKWNSNELRIKDVANHYSASIERIKKELKWKPENDIKNGIKKFYSWVNKVVLTVEDFKNIYNL